MRKFQKIVLSVVLLSFLSFCVLPVNVWADKGGQETEEESFLDRQINRIGKCLKDLSDCGKAGAKKVVNAALEGIEKTGKGVENIGKGIENIGKETQDLAKEGQQKLVGEEKKVEKEIPCEGVIFDPICEINNWILDLARDFFSKAIEIIANIMNYPRKILDQPTVKTYYGYFANTAWAFITVFTLFHLVRILANYWVNEDTQELKSLMVKLVVTTAMCGMYPSVFPLLVQVSSNTTLGFANVGIKLENIDRVTNVFLFVPKVAISATLFMMLIFAILMLIIAFQVCLRSAELAFLFIAGPFAIATNLNNDFNLFPAWWRSFLSLLITQVIQIVLLMLFIELFAGGLLDLLQFERFIFGIGFAFLIMKSPSFIKEFMYSTGSGQMAVNVISKTAGSVGSRIGKQMVSRIVKK
ncbi:conjugal transfer protein TrbL family protein [Laceyella tengchongensis]|uniref:conjugal transfer protein TrbL family protein n=1 Tax=Laceyella tengchongensis TaxID=574699 RepID=UPI0012B89315|nr:hypothetical protein [Laceyella tengchongensis]